MRNVCLLLAGIALLWSGCSRGTAEPAAGARVEASMVPSSLAPAAKAPPVSASGPGASEPVVHEVKRIPLPVDTELLRPAQLAGLPAVNMSQASRLTCKAFVGDLLPQAELADLSGRTQTIGPLLGKRLSIVLFWRTGGSKYSRMAAEGVLADLQHDVIEPYGPQDVAVVDINVGDPPASAREVVEAAGAHSIHLIDPNEQYFHAVASEGLPRLYAVDGDGKIAWLDVEYSEATRDALKRLLAAMLP